MAALGALILGGCALIKKNVHPPIKPYEVGMKWEGTKSGEAAAQRWMFYMERCPAFVFVD